MLCRWAGEEADGCWWWVVQGVMLWVVGSTGVMLFGHTWDWTGISSQCAMEWTVGFTEQAQSEVEGEDESTLYTYGWWVMLYVVDSTGGNIMGGV